MIHAARVNGRRVSGKRVLLSSLTDPRRRRNAELLRQQAPAEPPRPFVGQIHDARWEEWPGPDTQGREASLRNGKRCTVKASGTRFPDSRSGRARAKSTRQEIPSRGCCSYRLRPTPHASALSASPRYFPAMNGDASNKRIKRQNTSPILEDACHPPVYFFF